jgi:bifunctional non-homologous end joining protein LigD
MPPWWMPILAACRISRSYLLQSKLRPSPPSGPEWLHEVKFDGFRIQLHKWGDEVRLFSRNGKDFTDRFPSIAAAVSALPTEHAVIDGEVVACNETGAPDFYSLLLHRASGVRVWFFDLLAIDAEDLREKALDVRKERLARLLSAAGNERLKLSESFDDGGKLLEAVGSPSRQVPCPF